MSWQASTSGCIATNLSKTRKVIPKTKMGERTASSSILSCLAWSSLRLMTLLQSVTKTSAKTHGAVSYTHLRAHETGRNLVCRLLLEKKKLHVPSAPNIRQYL